MNRRSYKNKIMGNYNLAWALLVSPLLRWRGSRCLHSCTSTLGGRVTRVCTNRLRTQRYEWRVRLERVVWSIGMLPPPSSLSPPSCGGSELEHTSIATPQIPPVVPNPNLRPQYYHKWQRWTVDGWGSWWFMSGRVCENMDDRLDRTHIIHTMGTSDMA